LLWIIERGVTMKANSFIGNAIVVSALSLSPFVANAGSVPGWEIKLNAAQGSAGINMYLGQRVDATDGIDGYYDVPAFTSDGFDAHLSLEGGRYWRDIRQYRQGSTKTWRIEIQPDGSGPVSLRWKPADIPPNVTVLLVDTVSGTIIDMKQDSEYEVQPDTTRELRIEAVTR